MKEPRILFVYPSSYDEQGRLIKRRKSFFPARTLPYLAALIPKHYRMHIVDELVEDLDFTEDVDLVVLTGMLRHIPRAVEISREFRKRGKKTMIGGVGAFALKSELDKSDDFDCRVTGEVDDLWKDILRDYEQGRLQPFYECKQPPELKDLPHARFDLINPRKYLRAFWDLQHTIIPIETSRGCPRDCDYCLVTRYFGKKIRYRPIDQVIAEIRYQGSKFVLFTDDNIAANPVRAKELFLALKPLKIHWVGQFESRVAGHPELLQMASDSGCDGALVGIESLVPENIRQIEKFHNAKLSFRDVVQAFDKASLTLIASMMFGLDCDTPALIDWTIEEVLKNKVDCLLPWMLTPTPGTPCHDLFRNEKRLIHENYSLYDYWHPVMRPKNMTPEELEAAYWKGLRRYYSLAQILRRQWPPRLENIPGMLYHLYFRSQVRKKIHPIA